jgi:hypothetical protein
MKKEQPIICVCHKISASTLTLRILLKNLISNKTMETIKIFYKTAIHLR